MPLGEDEKMRNNDALFGEIAEMQDMQKHGIQTEASMSPLMVMEESENRRNHEMASPPNVKL